VVVEELEGDGNGVLSFRENTGITQIFWRVKAVSREHNVELDLGYRCGLFGRVITGISLATETFAVLVTPSALANGPPMLSLETLYLLNYAQFFTTPHGLFFNAKRLHPSQSHAVI
jgi:hypothetical protein